jgi:uncharacterized protein
VVLIAGTLPGVIAGSVIRVELLPSASVFDFVVAGVLLPLGIWLALTSPTRADAEVRPVRAIPTPALILLAVVVGCVGGIYGIGGGSVLAPVLIGTGRPPKEVAPAALASTFVTSVAGVITFLVLSVHHHGSVAPDWPTGIALGVGGLAGAYTGARIQGRLPDTVIRRVMGVLVVAIGARYLWSQASAGATDRKRPPRGAASESLAAGRAPPRPRTRRSPRRPLPWPCCSSPAPALQRLVDGSSW